MLGPQEVLDAQQRDNTPRGDLISPVSHGQQWPEGAAPGSRGPGGQPPPPSWHRAQDGAQVPLVVPATDPVLGALDPLPLCPTSVSKLKPSSGRRRKAGAAGGTALTCQQPGWMKVPSTLPSRAGSASERSPARARHRSCQSSEGPACGTLSSHVQGRRPSAVSTMGSPAGGTQAPPGGGWGTQPHWPCHLSAHGHTGAAVAPALTQERRTLFLLPQMHRQPHPVPHEACFVPASVSPAFLPKGVAAGANTCVKIVGFRKIVKPGKCDRNSRAASSK